MLYQGNKLYGVKVLQIHVVKPGETLWKIAQLYSIPLIQLIQANKIPNPEKIVIGQSLVIPIWGEYHWIKPGENLFKISQNYGVSVQELIRINGIANPDKITVGMRLYIPQKKRKLINVGAYIDPSITGQRSVKEIGKIGNELTFLNVFSYHLNLNGTLSPVNDQKIINASYQKSTVPLMVLTNFDNGTFSKEIASRLFNDEVLQDKVLNEAIRIMKEKGYLGLDFDFEYLGAENREKYNQFLRKASIKLKENGYLISSALAPKVRENQVGVLYEGHDYRAHGNIVDFIFFMTYEWGWSGGPPMPVSPINKVRKVMEYAISKVPKEKIMMGIPLYGYDWTLPYIKGGKWAKSISPQEAIRLAAKYNTNIEYDDIAQAPYFKYIDEQKREHVVWFEDARSIQAKFNLVNELGIKGFFYWVLGHEFPQNWLLIQDNFVVRKKV